MLSVIFMWYNLYLFNFNIDEFCNYLVYLIKSKSGDLLENESDLNVKDKDNVNLDEDDNERG